MVLTLRQIPAPIAALHPRPWLSGPAAGKASRGATNRLPRAPQRGEGAWHAERRARGGDTMIRKLKSGEYRLYSRRKNEAGKRRNLGTFSSLERAKQHERAVQFFKKH
jgi:hypothetical protein